MGCKCKFTIVLIESYVDRCSHVKRLLSKGIADAELSPPKTHSKSDATVKFVFTVLRSKVICQIRSDTKVELTIIQRKR